MYTIENDYLIAKITPYGAALVSLVDKRSGIDVVLGFDDEQKYQKHEGNPYFGATVGRFANRIANGRFELNGITYKLDQNNGVNAIHGGQIGLTWRKYHLQTLGDDKVIFRVFSCDNEDGYPGDLTMEISYRLCEDKLIFGITGQCSKDSLFNITNHSYFNLNGKGDILNHRLQIFADKVALNDENGMATIDQLGVADTAFDFREAREIGANLKRGHANLDKGGGLDHHFVVENLQNKVLAKLQGERLLLTVESDLPGVQVYTASKMQGIKGKNDQLYGPFAGIALECQYYPNNINYEGVLQALIHRREIVSHYISYQLSEI